MDYHSKYLKYREKYLKLKKGGGILSKTNDNLDFFFRFNTDNKEIIKKYKNFNDLSLVETPIVKIGKKSINGFVYRLSFKTENKDEFYTVLKTSIEKTTDNNYYEYVVGNCINKLKEYYPNFIYTFNYLNITEELKKELIKNEYFNDVSFLKSNSDFKTISVNELQNNLNIGNGCENNDRSSILLEYIPNSISIKDLEKNENFLSSVENLNLEIYNILFQVYFTLASLSKVFTHYDLHKGNVMLIEIPDGKKMEIQFKIKDKFYTIFTSFIPVFLDYGRSFIDCLNIDNIIYSKIFSEVVCANEKCNPLQKPECNATYYGLAINKDSNDNYSKQEHFYFTNLRVKNESFDLYFLHLFMKDVRDAMPIKQYYNAYFKNDTTWVEKKVPVKPVGKPIPSRVAIREPFKPVVKSPVVDEPPTLKKGVKEDLSNIAETSKISNVNDCLLWLLSIYDRIYPIVHPKVYGRMKINFELSEKVKWSFEKL